jgi:SAM-dependent methyltransferase
MTETGVFDQDYSTYYNLLYADKDYSAEAGYIDQLIRHYSPGAKTILEYGSGTGGHGVLLKEKGYDILGIERSAAMADIARSRGLTCEVGDITTLQLDKTFDSVISLFHVISYINANDQLLKLFADTKKRVKKGGVFIFDTWFSPAVLHQMPERREKKMENQEAEVFRTATPEIDHLGNVVHVNYHIKLKNKLTGLVREFDEKHSMRHFGVPEIALLASQTGFEMVHAEEFLTGGAPSEKTWGVTFILKNVL